MDFLWENKMTVKINTKLTTENITKTPETEFSNSATIPVIDNNEIKNILLSNLNGAGMVPNVITIDTSLLPDGSQDIEGKSYSTFAKAKAYCDTAYGEDPNARFEIHLPAGNFTERIDIMDYYIIIGHNTVCQNVINIINESLIYSVILKNTDITSSSIDQVAKFIHCIVDGNLNSADARLFFYNCIFRGGNLGEKTLTFDRAEIRNTILIIADI